VLKLATETPQAWAETALRDLEAVLVDHAHLEKKAAGTAVTLLFRYPERPELQVPLAHLAQEELEHFAQVLGLLERRGIPLRRMRASPYAGRLHREVRDVEPERLVDTLLVAALIEARSCERMQRLAETLAARDRDLADFYRRLLVSEARHHGVYVRLAEQVAGVGAARERLRELAACEGRIVAELGRSPQLHG